VLPRPEPDWNPELMAIRRRGRPEIVGHPAAPDDPFAHPPMYEGNGHNGDALPPLEPLPGRIGDLLVGDGIVTVTQLANALMHQHSSGERLGAVLIAAGLLDERTLAYALSQQSGLDVVNLGEQTPDVAAVALLAEHVARDLGALPLDIVDDRLRVAVSDPRQPDLIAKLRAGTNQEITLVLAPPADIMRTINASYSALTGVERFVQAFEATDAQRRVANSVLPDQAPTDDAPVVQVVNMIVTQALRERASDVHLEPQDRRIRVRFRTDGALHDSLSLPASMGPALISRVKIMAGMNIVERRRSQDGQFTITIDGRALDVRVATTATIWGEKCVLRLLDKSRSLFALSELGMPADTAVLYSRIIRSPFGMVLCAGPTGSGKTTTLYATLSEINEPHRNIMTIEDPVEYVFPSINQIQTNEQAGLTFADGLRAILRQDPDIILVGEIRDVETARIAVQSALTGHLVMSSVHATDTAAALHRFLDMGIESFLISSSIVAVVAQRLMRRICPTCRTPYQPPDEELAFYEEAGGPPKTEFWVGRGCNFCAGTGYLDRIGVYELMRITPEIKRLIVGWATQDELRRLAVQQGMRTLRDDAIGLVANDVTTISEVVRGIYAL
jgi:type IV pilus assembly protein PilB